MRYVPVMLLAVLLAGVANAGVVLTVEDHSIQSSQVPGVVVEMFDGFAAGTYRQLTTQVGTMTSPAPGQSIVNADAFGGAGSGGRYFQIGGSNGANTSTLSLPAASTYLGLYLCAADDAEGIELFSGNKLVASLNNAVLLPQIQGPYAHNPSNPNSIFEPFAFLNFFATGGTTFDRVDFTTIAPSGLELDNLSIGTGPVEARGTVIENGVVVPEPQVFPLLIVLAILVTSRTLVRRRMA
jgi:hypothetical protein